MEKCINKIVDLSFNHGIFDEIIDCTYVLLCCGPKPQRENSVYKNLDVLRPTSNVKLIYNNGYKNCCISTSPMDDMAAAQIYIFKHALKNNYNRILFLEDDFTVPSELKVTDVINITKFIKDKDPCLYGLGNFMIPTPLTLLSLHQVPIFNFIPLAHAVIYNKTYMEKAIEYYSYYSPVVHQDMLPLKLKEMKYYRYYKPLIYQTFPQTENQVKSWKKIFNSNFLLSFVLNSIKIIKLDKQIQPGYTIVYSVSYLFYILILVTLYVTVKKVVNN
jgi:hypothetical protein